MVRWGTEIALAERCVLDLLVAAGHVSAEKVDEARAIAAFRKGGEWGASHFADPAYQQEQREKNERARKAMDAAAIRQTERPLK